MSVHAYPTRAMCGDYLRAAAGAIPCLSLLAALPLARPAAAVLAGLAALFGGFALRTALRHRSRIEMSETALSAVGRRGAPVAWAALDGMRLAYYAPRREREGWMQLVVRAGRAKLSLDSRIEGFALLVARAAEAAAARRLPLDPATRANLAALGLPVAAPPALLSGVGEPA